jgi:hypothetical protein
MTGKRPHALICLVSAESYTREIRAASMRRKIAYSGKPAQVLSCNCNSTPRRCIHVDQYSKLGQRTEGQ